MPVVFDAICDTARFLILPRPIHMIALLLLIQLSPLQEALTFHASFDSTSTADVAAGDPVLYRAQGWGERDNARPAVLPEGVVSIIPHGGRHGGALNFSRYAEALYFFRAQDNLPYHQEGWNATISFWLKLDPNQGLVEGQWCDPIQITSRAWDDASIFVDFTRNRPRQFRFAAFADRTIWNPDNQPWEEMVPGVMPMITVSDPPFSHDSWTHVVLVLQKFNTDQNHAVLFGYLNGELSGVLEGRDQILTWNSEEVLTQIGLQFKGQIDDLAFFNRDLSTAEIQQLYMLPEGIAALHK